MCTFAPQVEADIIAAVQETEAALQLLQKTVQHLFVVKELFWQFLIKKKQIKVLRVCLQLRATLVHVAVWSTEQQDRWEEFL